MQKAAPVCNPQNSAILLQDQNEENDSTALGQLQNTRPTTKKNRKRQGPFFFFWYRDP